LSNGSFLPEKYYAVPNSCSELSATLYMCTTMTGQDLARVHGRMLLLWLAMNEWNLLDVTETNYWHDSLSHLVHSLFELSYHGLITVKHIEESGESFLKQLKDYARYRSNGQDNLSTGVLLYEYHKKQGKKFKQRKSAFIPVEYHNFAIANCIWKLNAIFANTVITHLESIISYPAIAACIDVANDRIIFKTGTSDKMEIFCLCGQHLSTTVVTSPLLRVWSNPQRQQEFINAILQNVQTEPLDKYRYKSLYLHTKSITTIPPKFNISPLVQILLNLAPTETKQPTKEAKGKELTKKQIQDQLRAAGQPVTGSKTDLMKRLSSISR